MNNLEFLEPGKMFPPLEEAKRVGSYTDYELLFDGNSHAVEKRQFKQTVKNLNTLAALLGWGEYYGVEYNYFRYCSVKTADFCCGEVPDIRGVSDEQSAVIDQILRDTKFYKKLYDAFVDVSMYGDVALRVYAKGGRNTFTLQHPGMLFRVTDPEDEYEVTHYVVAWVQNIERSYAELKVQIHEKGSYTERVYRITPAVVSDLSGQVRYRLYGDNPKSDLFALLNDRLTDEIFRVNCYKICEQITPDRVVNTGLDDFAIIDMTNTRSADKTYGTSDYEAFSSIVAAIERTMTEAQLVFDKFTVPTMYGDSAMTTGRNAGENVLEIGKFLGIPEGGTIPAYLEPDINKLQQYWLRLEFDVKRIRELSELGAALDCDVTANVSTETMKATYSSALKKAERLTTRNEDGIKTLIHLLSMGGYTEIPADDITITWYDGLPNDEGKEIANATNKVAGNLSSLRHEAVSRFNMTDEAWDKVFTEHLQELNDISATTFAGMGNSFGGNQGDEGDGNDVEESEQSGNVNESESEEGGKA